MPDFIGIRHHASFMPKRNTEGVRRRASDRQYSACRIAPVRRTRSLAGEGRRAVWQKRSKVFHRALVNFTALSRRPCIVLQDILHRIPARVAKIRCAICDR
jgi:hypothetical protein